MCTVSYLPKAKGDFILSSNRDEKIARPTNPPWYYEKNGVKTCYPVDEKAGGTWIAMNQTGRVCCLLNGAFENHQPKDYYTKSRGKIVLEAIKSIDINEYLSQTSLRNVEPFTLVIIEKYSTEQTTLTEFRWDGMQKFQKLLNPAKAYIWSSATLYSSEIRQARKKTFHDWVYCFGEDAEAKDILSFHKTKRFSKQDANKLLEKGEKPLKTVSITQVELTNKVLKMTYHDLLKQSSRELDLEIYEKQIA